MCAGPSGIVETVLPLSLNIQKLPYVVFATSVNLISWAGRLKTDDRAALECGESMLKDNAKIMRICASYVLPLHGP